MCTDNLCFEQKKENDQKCSTEKCIFYSFNNRCILHRHVCVMTWVVGICWNPFILKQEEPLEQNYEYQITQTCLCNMQRFLNAVKMMTFK